MDTTKITVTGLITKITFSERFLPADGRKRLVCDIVFSNEYKTGHGRAATREFEVSVWREDAERLQRLYRKGRLKEMRKIVVTGEPRKRIVTFDTGEKRTINKICYGSAELIYPKTRLF